ncbi:MAG: hypothetical protein CVV21_04980 [Candidatus Goldiibacteriota bacterium HGW-Goldbacteria-1]|jgi:PAS domain S-box-containing protein|nr:MAG: hypothetical protein CVV21_04980 [Candidatus Goldiibacteriota bacterium HGW-Goldbacteria-1]
MVSGSGKEPDMEQLVLEQDVIYEINTDSVIVSWNRGAELLYGWKKTEAVGKTAYELFKTEFHLRMYEFIAETVKNYIWTGELSQFKRDGTGVIVSSHAILHRDDDGKPKGIIFVNLDITRLKKTAEALKQSEEMFSVTINSIGDGVLATDTNGCVTILNQVAQELTGWTQRDAFGKQVDKVFNIINYDSRKPAAVPIMETLKFGTVKGLANHTVLISKDKSERDIADSCAPIKDREGKVIGAVLVFRDVTERMQKDAALEKTRLELAATKISEDAAREYAESLIDTIREPLIALDQDLRVVSVSRSFYEFFRVKPEDTVGKLIYDLGNKQWDIPKLRQLLERILPQKTTFDNYEVEHDFDFIGRRIMLLNARQIIRAAGKESIILLAIEDVTQRRNSEYILTKFNNALRAISNTNQALMHVKSEQEYINKVCRIIVDDCGMKMVWVGFTSGNNQRSLIPMAEAGDEGGYLKKLGKTWTNISEGNHPAEMAVRMGKTVLTFNINNDVNFAPWRTEALKHSFASLMAIPLKSDNKTFGVLMVYSAQQESYPDAEVKLFEELAYDLSYGIIMIRMRKEKTAVELEVKKIAAFPKLDPNPISEIDSTGKLYYINPAFKKMFPDAAKNTLQHPWFEGISGIFVNLKGSRKKIIKRDIKVNNKYYLQTMVYIPAEETIRTYGVDVTKKINSENEIKKLYTHMELKVQRRTSELLASKHLADLGTLAATVAHELRNPLGVINLASYNIRKKVKDKDLLKHLASIDKKVTESGQIINNLLVYSRMKMPEFEMVNIHTLISESIDNVSRHFEDKKIKISAMMSTVKKVYMWADPLQIKEVFTNIITNAYQAIEGKEGKVTVKAALISGRRIKVSVKDTGIGISKEDMGKMFKPFFTRKTKGTGLGLLICRDMIKMHDGTIGIVSTYGKGSTFTVTLPLRRVHG